MPFARGFMFAMMVIITGYLASLVSVPPRWMHAIWPPSGIAIVGLALWGRRFWPAPFIGCFIVFVCVAHEKYAFLATSLQIVIGSTILSALCLAQTFFGLYLLRNTLGKSLSLTHPRQIVLFLIIVGPCQGMVGALCGPLLPMTTGAWPWEEYPSIAFDWWRSQVVGGIAFSVILLSLIGTPQEEWRPRRRTVSLPLAVWLMIFALVYLMGPNSLHGDVNRARLGIELVGSLVLVLLAALLLVITGQAAAIAEEADARAAMLIEEIAARRSTESALAVSEARLALAQRIARIGAWEWDPIRDRTVWTDEMYRLFGYEPGGFEPNLANFFECVHPDDRAAVRKHMDAAIQGTQPYRFDFRVQHPNGDVRVLHADAIIERDEDGQPVLWRGTDQDVTERVQAETDQRRLDDRLRTTQRWESLGQLAGGVAHDFNNLMTGVLGHATLTREQLPQDSPLHETLRPIEDAAHHAASLCQQLLAFAGKGAGHRGPIDLRALVNETLELMRMSVPKTVDLRLGLNFELPIIEGDRSQLKQVLLNLVWNASEAMGASGGVIEIRFGATRNGGCPTQAAGHYCGSLAPGAYVWVEVRDTGLGIPPDVMSRMFEPFFTTKDTGRGLGLSAVAGIVRGHGGCVCVTSRVGAGSCLRVYLAALDDEAVLQKLPPANPVEHAQPLETVA